MLGDFVGGLHLFGLWVEERVLGRDYGLEFCGGMKLEVWSDGSVKSNQLNVSHQPNKLC